MNQYRVRALIEVALMADGEDELQQLVEILNNAPEVKRVCKIRRVITEEIVDGIGIRN